MATNFMQRGRKKRPKRSLECGTCNDTKNRAQLSKENSDPSPSRTNQNTVLGKRVSHNDCWARKPLFTSFGVKTTCRSSSVLPKLEEESLSFREGTRGNQSQPGVARLVTRGVQEELNRSARGPGRGARTSTRAQGWGLGGQHQAAAQSRRSRVL